MQLILEAINLLRCLNYNPLKKGIPMINLTNVRIIILGMMVLAMTLIAPATARHPVNAIDKDLSTEHSASIPIDSLASTSTFYIVRPDLRKCASPRCGGYFIRSANQYLTRCANGRSMSECYVTNIQWNGAPEIEINRALLRGTLLTKGNRNGRYGVLSVSEVWRAASDAKPYGDFFRVRDLGVRCIAAPCLSHSEAKLNSTQSKKIAGISLNDAGANEQAVSDALKSMTSKDGVLVAGGHTLVTGPAGRALMLNAAQFYLRANSSAELKPCMKTGCSGQICSDEEVVTTCEYRTEYECYKKAKCERQANGECGFTKTPELTSCLNKR
jgi:hypothetical protein